MSDSERIMIRADGLTRRFGPLTAVRDVSFAIERGRIVAFLGPNGAGKTTTMRLLAGYLAPTRGRAEIAGIDVERDRIAAVARLGYLPAGGPLYDDMTPRRLLRFLGEARGMGRDRVEARIADVRRICGLERAMEKPIGKLSTGYRQRVGIAQAILHEPEVLILDEPTSGLDPNQIRGVRELITELGRTRTILLSTHVLQEVDAVASRVIFIHEGRIVFDDGIEAFRRGAGSMDDHFRSLTAA